MLDPIKVGIVSPGMNDDGSLDESGIPGPLVNAYLESYGTVAARTTDFQVLVMFSIGVTKGKWNTLIRCVAIQKVLIGDLQGNGFAVYPCPPFDRLFFAHAR